jgi:hypothetical protein
MRGLNRYKYSGHSVLMGKGDCDWQETNYVLSYFGKGILQGRENYYSYMKEGMDQGRRPELVGGGLIRELGVEGTRMAKRLNMSRPGVSYAVKKGEKIVKDNGFKMIG